MQINVGVFKVKDVSVVFILLYILSSDYDYSCIIVELAKQDVALYFVYYI